MSLVHKAAEQDIIRLDGADEGLAEKRCDRLNLVLFGTLFSDPETVSKLVVTQDFLPILPVILSKLGTHYTASFFAMRMACEPLVVEQREVEEFPDRRLSLKEKLLLRRTASV